MMNCIGPLQMGCICVIPRDTAWTALPQTDRYSDSQGNLAFPNQKFTTMLTTFGYRTPSRATPSAYYYYTNLMTN